MSMSKELNEIPEELNDEEIADFLGVSKATVKAWTELVDINTKGNTKSERKYDRQSIKILETVKKLREKDKGYNTIIRLLKNNSLSLEKPVHANIVMNSSITKELASKQNTKELSDFTGKEFNYSFDENILTSFKQTEKNVNDIIKTIGRLDDFHIDGEVAESVSSNPDCSDFKSFEEEVKQNTCAITRLHGCVQDLEERFKKVYKILEMQDQLKQILPKYKEMENRINFISDKYSLLEKETLKKDDIENRFCQINIDNTDMKRDLLLLKTINGQLLEKDAKIENHLLTIEQKKNIEKSHLNTLKGIVEDLYSTANTTEQSESNNRFTKETQNEYVVQTKPTEMRKNNTPKNSHDENSFTIMRLEEKLRHKDEKISLLENHIKLISEPRGFWAKLKKFLLQF